LQALRNQLAAKYLKTRLDAYSLYVYGVVLSKLKLNDEAINILVESVKKKPTLWCTWLELANLIKSVEMVCHYLSYYYFLVIILLLIFI
jgi:anaphase-promoting complex subunit 8